MFSVSVLFTALVLNAIHVEVNRDDKPSKSLAVRLPRREMEICLKTEEIPRYVENKDKTRRQHEYILLILTTCEKVFEEKFDQFKDQAKNGFIKLNQKFQEEIDKLQKLLTEELQEVRIEINLLIICSRTSFYLFFSKSFVSTKSIDNYASVKVAFLQPSMLHILKNSHMPFDRQLL